MKDFDLSEISGSKWSILKQLSKESSTPKEIAEKLGVTIANVSQQLRLLEALSYVKKERADKGPGGRKKNDRRIIYSISNEKNIFINLAQGVASKQEIPDTPINQLVTNIWVNDLKKQSEYLLKFYFDDSNVIQNAESVFFLKEDAEGIHLLVIAENIKQFRESSKMSVKIGKETKKIVFWSHTKEDMIKGLEEKEVYFLEQAKKAVFLFGTKNKSLTTAMSGAHE